MSPLSRLRQEIQKCSCDAQVPPRHLQVKIHRVWARLTSAMGQLDGFEGNNPKPATGVAAGPGWGCDSNRITQWTGHGGAVQWVPSCIPDYSLGLQNGGAFEPTPVSYAPTI